MEFDEVYVTSYLPGRHICLAAPISPRGNHSHFPHPSYYLYRWLWWISSAVSLPVTSVCGATSSARVRVGET
jgi:hypothetical protein